MTLMFLRKDDTSVNMSFSSIKSDLMALIGLRLGKIKEYLFGFRVTWTKGVFPLSIHL